MLETIILQIALLIGIALVYKLISKIPDPGGNTYWEDLCRRRD